MSPVLAWLPKLLVTEGRGGVLPGDTPATLRCSFVLSYCGNSLCEATMDTVAAPKRRRLVIGDEDSLAEEGQPRQFQKHWSADSDDDSFGGHAVRIS